MPGANSRRFVPESISLPQGREVDLTRVTREERSQATLTWWKRAVLPAPQGPSSRIVFALRFRALPTPAPLPLEGPAPSPEIDGHHIADRGHQVDILAH
jgi:hypothetical protein